MGSHVVWELDGEDRLIRPLFVGSESECLEVAPALYDLMIDFAGDDWQSVCVRVMDNDGEAWVDGGIVEVDEFAWFKTSDGCFVWGEVSMISDCGDIVDGAVMNCEVVHFDQGFVIGGYKNAFEDGVWAMDEAKCFGVGSVGLVAL